MKNKIFFLMIYLLLILSQQAQSGTIWKWRDENNVIHYSDSKKKVPAAYQRTAEEISVAGAPASIKGEVGTTPPVVEKNDKEKSEDNSGVIKELASQIYSEITRDRNILNYAGNQISLSLTLESLANDLIKKREILKKIETEKVEKPQIKTWLVQNINQEQAIADTLKGPVTENKFTFALRKVQESIESNLKGKEMILATLTQK